MTRRRLVAWIAPVLLGALLSGCTFSSGSTTEVTDAGQAAGGASGAGGAGGSRGKAADRKPAQPTTPKAPHVSALCDSLVAVYLTDISDAKDAASILNDWAQVTAAAPRSLKKDLTTVGAYLATAAKGDYATLKGASDMVDKALDHVDRYVTKVCRA